MKLLRTSEQEIDRNAMVCRQSPTSQVIGTGIISIVLLFCPLMWWWLEAPMWVMVMTVLCAVFVVPICIGEIISALKKTNWLLAIQADGLWVNLRSFRNRKFASATTVVYLPWSDLRSAAATDGLTRLPWDTSSVGKVAFLEVQLANHVQADELQQAILEEDQRRSLPREFAGATLMSKSRHTPVQLTDDRRLRLAWRSPMDLVTPALYEVLTELSRELEIEKAPATPGFVISHTEELSLNHSPERIAELHAEVLELAELGQLLDAIRLYRVRKGCGLQEARDSVNELLKTQ